MFTWTEPDQIGDETGRLKGICTETAVAEELSLFADACVDFDASVPAPSAFEDRSTGGFLIAER